jgi:hypothetical protein
VLPLLQIRQLYDRFDVPVTAFDCGTKCAPSNPSGKPFCCDICHAVPAAYRQEWAYLEHNTDLWHVWRGDECVTSPHEPQALHAETPEHMLLLACLGPAYCQREYRAISCRQFPFFPYIGSDYRFLGLACEWTFENTCWVISNLGQVTPAYRDEFMRFYQELFAASQEELDGYLVKSEELREVCAARKRRFPLLHRNGGYYLVSPQSERMQRLPPERLPRYGYYR